MRLRIPFTITAIVLGSFFSFGQQNPSSDPFTRFSEGVRSNRLDVATVRFAAQCTVNLDLAHASYAVKPGDKWVSVADLAKGMESDEMATDFYSVTALWKYANTVVIELWDIEGDTGSEARALYCFQQNKIAYAENLQWSLPVTDELEKTNPGWGYEQRWLIDAAGKYTQALARFVNDSEHPIPTPKLEPGEEPDYRWAPSVHSPSDLKLPAVMFQ